MPCLNHPEVAATARCAGCAEDFCENCMVEINGQHYCGSCKVMAVTGQPQPEVATMPCKEAGEALTYAIFGLFCFGIILEPVAIVKAVKARKMLEANPQLTGSGKATAAMIIAIVGLVLWVVGLIVRIGTLGQ